MPKFTGAPIQAPKGKELGKLPPVSGPTFPLSLLSVGPQGATYEEVDSLINPDGSTSLVGYPNNYYGAVTAASRRL